MNRFRRWLYETPTPGYKRRDPDPISLGVMTPPPPVPEKLTRRYRKVQARMDRIFWGLIHDHNWLQYHHCDPRLSTPWWKRWRHS